MRNVFAGVVLALVALYVVTLFKIEEEPISRLKWLLGASLVVWGLVVVFVGPAAVRAYRSLGTDPDAKALIAKAFWTSGFIIAMAAALFLRLVITPDTEVPRWVDDVLLYYSLGGLPLGAALITLWKGLSIIR